MAKSPQNVLGEPLQACCRFPMTGFTRDGFCHLHPEDESEHTVCVEITAEFLEASREMGNDLTKAAPQYDFPGLIPGDRWCLCASRWVEAYHEGCAPRVVLAATHESVLEHVPLEVLKEYAVPQEEDGAM